jgi:hypothetical protein
MKIFKNKFWNKFCINSGGFESIYFIPHFFGIIGICKHIGVAFTSDLGLDIIKLDISCNFIFGTFYIPIVLHSLYLSLMFHVVHISLHILKDKMTNKKM